MWFSSGLQVSAFIVCVLIAVLSVVSILIVGKAISDDASTVYASTKEFLTSESLFGSVLMILV